MTPDRSLRRQAIMIASFATLYLVWGSTYLGIRWAIESIPALLMAGTRFVAAGGVLYALARWRSAPRPTLRQWWNGAVVGAFMFTGGNGLVCWAEKTVPSGLACLLIATTPLWMVSLDSLFFRAALPTARVLLGLILGLAGVATLLGPAADPTTGVDPAGGAALLFACCCWSFASLRSRSLDLPKSLFVTAGMQMIAGGLLLLLLGTWFGEWNQFDWQAVSARSWWSFLYLIVCGSMLALSAYTWLLRNCHPASLSTYAYVNPVVAVLLGAWLADETITARTGLAAGLIIVSVIVTVTRRAAP